ncbi:methyltransferase [Herbiconiux sp. CPCC 205763]|uniref:Methyltransferase n=1 Tax=Herbiconiux aconitum TaxID=2970913 RepID=A0ABT2GQV0_9MICO|nr:methyltransferase [Herbiconiux aconitum]MCS5718506.1 methyltransferase [Herbiconiux aconitum]
MDHESIDLLREDLTAARYRVDVLDSLWGEQAASALFRGRRLPAERALGRLRASGDPLPPAATLAALFVLGDAVPAHELAAALPRLGVQGASALGLVGAASGPDDVNVRALLDLRPYSFVDSLGAGSWWVVSDLGEAALGRALDEDHVLGIGGASNTLSGLMIPTPADSVLDLGTGCGIQAMHAARHAQRVVATDISRRALELAALNARLNGIDSIEFRHGSLFEPVQGERFDRIVSNPPFVITPRVQGVPQYEYRDGGMVGDALVEQVVRQTGEHLTPGGIAQLLGNWEYRASAELDGLERVRGWVEGADGPGLDAWVIERERQDAASYAETWIRDGGTRPGTPGFDPLYGAWLDDFEARGVLEVGFGYVLLRRPALGGEPTLARYERVDSAIGSNPSGLGDHLAVSLAGHDWAVYRDDAALLRETLVYASDVTEERHYWPGHDDPVVMTLRQGGGFARSVPLDTGLAAFVGACDGDLSVGAIIAAIASLLAVSEQALRADLLPPIRALLADAFLLPAAP